MALINCKECGKEVSTEAVACPNCGAKPPKPPKKHGFPIAAILIIAIFALVNHQLSTPESPEERAKKEERLKQARSECSKIGAKIAIPSSGLAGSGEKAITAMEDCMASHGFPVKLRDE